MTEYISSPVLNQNPQQMEDLLRSSIYTGYHSMDQAANTFAGMFGGVAPVEIAASIGPLIGHCSKDREALQYFWQKEYNQIISILAPSFDILWIQNVHDLLALEVILEIAKLHKDDEQIWLN